MSNKKYLIAFDMDGTLLVDHTKVISPKTREYLKSLAKQGHKIILASGRPESELIHYHQELGLDTPLACFNGVDTINHDDPNFPELGVTFPKEYAIEIANKFIKNGIWDNGFCETNKKIWMVKEDQKIIDFMWPHGIKRDCVFGQLEDTLKEDPMTLIIYKENDKDDIENLRKFIKKYPNSELRPWFGKNIAEIVFTTHGKAEALEHIRQYYKIPIENTIAFGDYLNDIKMIKWAKYGVAMKNGCDEIKKVADMITEDDNNHDGIVATLKSIIENN